jgi:hypothetical protein
VQKERKKVDSNLPKVELTVTKRKQHLSNKFVLSIFAGSQEDTDAYTYETEIDPTSPEKMEILKMGLYLLKCVDLGETKYDTYGTPEMQWVEENNATVGEIQQHIIFEAGKKLFLEHNPIRPICTLFPMGESLTKAEYLDYATQERGVVLTDVGWGKHEWPYHDEELVQLQGWEVTYYDKEGKEYLVEYQVERKMEEKESG